MNDFYISYSGRKAYLTCPKKYKLNYVDRIREPSDPQAFLFGSIIGKVFEWFYEKRFWAESDVVQTTIDSIQLAIDDTLKRENVYIKDDFRTKLIEDLEKFVPLGVKTIKDNKLLSNHSRSEVKLDITYATDNLSIKFGGRTDFLHIFDKNQAWILDGKGSKWRDKYIDPEQLIWYATQFFLRYHMAPSRLGFIFWRFPEDPIQWVSYGDGDIRANLKQTIDIVNKIIDKEFDPTPGSYCNLCGYAPQCENGTAYRNAHKLAKSALIESSIFDLERI